MRRWSEFQPHRGWLSNQWLGFQPVGGNPPMVGEFPTIYLSWPWCSGELFFVELLSTVFKAWGATTAWPGRDLAGAWSAGIDHTTYYGPSSLLPRPSQLLK